MELLLQYEKENIKNIINVFTFQYGATSTFNASINETGF